MSLYGTTNAEKIWNYFLGKGMSEFGIAGLIGNLDCESALIPNNLEDIYEHKLGYTNDSYTNAVDSGLYKNFVNDQAGFGIAQWTWWTRKQGLLDFAKSMGKSIGDLEMQLGYLEKELRSMSNGIWSTLISATSVQIASNAVLLKFECPLDQSASVQNYRASVSQKYYDRFHGITSKKEVVAMGYYTLAKGLWQKLSNNFSSNEFDCHGVGCCTKTIINEQLVKYLQQISDHFGKPVTITSAYRCPIHNASVRGATGSRHCAGDAADIVVAGVAPLTVARYAESIGIKGIGLYETAADGYFVHIDTRTTKSFWYGQAQAYRSTFGSSTTQTANISVGTGTSKKYIAYGASGSDVKELQNKLIKLGYSCGVCGADGSYGLGTKIAVTAFQRDNGLDADGVIGDLTMAALNKAINKNGTEYTVTANLLNVRSGAGINNQIVATVAKGSTLLITEEQDGWGKFVTGWVSMQYVQRKE